MTTNWTPLARALPGRLIRPGDPGYHTVRRRHVAFESEPLPAAVARCSTAGDVAAAVGFARDHQMPFALRSGGHSYAGHSSTAGLLIDLSGIDNVEVDTDRAPPRVTVGAGVTVAGVHRALAGTGWWLPTGSCPTVGLAGSTLAGGFGFLGRRWGLAADLLVSADLVLADGNLVTVDEQQEPELFWALRGAGPGTFAAVVALEFRTVPARPLTSFLHRWPLSAGPEAIDAWQRWAPDAPTTVTAHLSLVAPDFVDEEPHVDLFGVADDPSAVDRLLDAIATPSSRSVVTPMSVAVASRYLAGLVDREHAEVPLPVDPPDRSGWMYARSQFVSDLIPPEAGAELVSRLAEGRVLGAQRDIELTPFGGAYAAASEGTTAFPHRSARLLVAHRVFLGVNASPEARAAERRWVNESWEAVRSPGLPAVYAGYADPHLPDFAIAYYGPNLARLAAAKRAYDPSNLFSHGQPVPLLPPDQSSSPC